MCCISVPQMPSCLSWLPCGITTRTLMSSLSLPILPPIPTSTTFVTSTRVETALATRETALVTRSAPSLLTRYSLCQGKHLSDRLGHATSGTTTVGRMVLGHLATSMAIAFLTHFEMAFWVSNVPFVSTENYTSSTWLAKMIPATMDCHCATKAAGSERTTRKMSGLVFETAWTHGARQCYRGLVDAHAVAST